MGHHPEPLSDLDLLRRRDADTDLRRLHSARHRQGDPPPDAVRQRQFGAGVHRLRDSRLCGRHRAAHGVRVEDGLVSPRWIRQRRFRRSIVRRAGQRHHQARRAAGVVVRRRQLRGHDAADEELADGQSRRGLRAHGDRKGHVVSSRGVPPCVPQQPRSDRDVVRQQHLADPDRIVPDREDLRHRRLRSARASNRWSSATIRW